MILRTFDSFIRSTAQRYGSDFREAVSLWNDPFRTRSRSNSNERLEKSLLICDHFTISNYRSLTRTSWGLTSYTIENTKVFM